MPATLVRAYMLVTLFLSVFLILALSAFEVLPLIKGENDLEVIKQANVQLARIEYLIKDVYILSYRGEVARAQAISELQSQIPIFEQVQLGLARGDASLGLPPNPSAGVRQSLLTAQPDYLALVTAMKTILATPDRPPDPVQVLIIAQHERPYLASMYPLTILLQQEAQLRVIQVLLIKLGLIGSVVLLIILKYLLFTRRVVGRMIEEDAPGGASPSLPLPPKREEEEEPLHEDPH